MVKRRKNDDNLLNENNTNLENLDKHPLNDMRRTRTEVNNPVSKKLILKLNKNIDTDNKDKNEDNKQNNNSQENNKEDKNKINELENKINSVEKKVDVLFQVNKILHPEITYGECDNPECPICKDRRNKDNKSDDELDKNRNKRIKIDPVFKPDLDDDLIFIKDILFGGLDERLKNASGNDKTKNAKDSTNKKDNCPNPDCDHKDNENKVNKLDIKEIKGIDDLINLGKTYHCKKNKEYEGLDLRILCCLVNPLTELKNMIGMSNVKDSIVNQILFFLQGLNKIESKDGFGKTSVNEDMLHTVITGPPGVGKTELGKILGKIYKEMGVLSKGTFKLVTRSDLVAEYLGQTAVKTQKVINECQGGVMFIDEAYSLGHENKRDSFSKECIDTLNQNLTEKRDFLCIIAGYKDSLDECFFSANDGLKRRFTFRYDIEGYKWDELRDILLLKIKKEGWKLFFENETDEEKMKEQKNKFDEFLKKNKGAFPNYGGDIETFFLNCKIAHSRRILFQNEKKTLSFEDIQKGYDRFTNHRKPKEDAPESFFN